MSNRTTFRSSDVQKPENVNTRKHTIDNQNVIKSLTFWFKYSKTQVLYIGFTILALVS